MKDTYLIVYFSTFLCLKVMEVIVAQQLRRVQMTLQDIDSVDSETVTAGERLDCIRSAKV